MRQNSVAGTVLLIGDDLEQKRSEILATFLDVFTRYEALFTCLCDEQAWFTKAISLRHPLIFYYGHTATFFINKLIVAQLLYTRLDPDIESMMAVGVDEMSWDDLNELHYIWPDLTTLRDYRARVKACVSNFIEQMPLSLPIRDDSPAWVILMGIEHERIHLETSSVLIRQLPLSWVKPNAMWPICPIVEHQRAHVPNNSLIAQPGNTLLLGKDRSATTYGWDNEYGQRTAAFDDFSVSRMLVSNAEFYLFVADNGYMQQQWWSDEGWRWCQFAKTVQPSFWIGDANQPEKLRLRLMLQEVPIPWNWPVEVNQLEADAFCRWKAAATGLPIKLPSEAQWVQLRQAIEIDHPAWLAKDTSVPANIDLAYWASPCPVDYFIHGSLCDVVGNVWQWTSTAIDGFDGFAVHPLYDDFSTPTFDGKHTLIKGGSWVSTGNLATQHARYAFRRHFFQHAGFRYVASNYQEPDIINPYETDQLVGQYLDFHYGQSHFSVPNFATQLIELVIPHCRQRNRALDIGCAVGRASFELARYFQEVDGVDYSARFIDIALSLTLQQEYRYAVPTEGELLEYRSIHLSQYNLPKNTVEKVRFTQGDACNLKDKYQQYDLVFAANLIDRLVNPALFLESMTKRIVKGGVLLLASPYTWLAHHTPKEHWLGGKKENGESLNSFQQLNQLLNTHFELITPPTDVPFVIRETTRKYQHTLSQVTLWRKK
ncbi:MAG: 5-histidylcysteine sulfoxide synthase [Plesiomonas sp.]|uniref:5-histidylcysteine sulfoxide synthase n=1 Tax=Plesiomonas sp. TaxID=2486279 RepID=UPI003F2A353E